LAARQVRLLDAPWAAGLRWSPPPESNRRPHPHHSFGPLMRWTATARGTARWSWPSMGRPPVSKLCFRSSERFAGVFHQDAPDAAARRRPPRSARIAVAAAVGGRRSARKVVEQR